jgi:hypothetical protein
MDQLTSFPIILLAATGFYLLVCGGFGAYVAVEKGRSGLEGFLFGLILGPIGVVAVGTLPTVERMPAVRSALLDDDEDKVRDQLGELERQAQA